jgi:hypothetical protein
MNQLSRGGQLVRDQNDTALQIILKKVDAARICLLGMCRLHAADTMMPSDLPRDDMALWRFLPPDIDAEPKPSQRLIMHSLLEISQLDYRRYKTNLMQRIFTRTGHPTCAWKLVMPLDDYARTITRLRYTKPQVWLDATSSPGFSALKNLTEYLEKSDDPEVPWLEPNRHIFSFANGVYMSLNEQFLPYADLGQHFALKQYPVACKHFDLEFDPAWLEATDPMDVPTPAMDEIFSDQRLTGGVRRWAFALFGRMQYNVGELDDWQVFPLLKGLAGTGKSVVLNHLRDMYDPQDVGTISNTIEKQFGLGQVAGKFIGIADDIRSSFQLDQSDFQNAISGNAVSCAIKHGKPTIFDPFITALCMSGNEPPGYTDNAGSWGRRAVGIPFNYEVQNPDSTMSCRLRMEMPAFILKCNWQYRNMLRRYGKQGIWKILPEEFAQQRAELTASTNALVGWMQSDQATLHREAWVPMDVVIESVRNYATSHNIRKTTWSPDYYNGPFRTYGLRVGKAPDDAMWPRTAVAGGEARPQPYRGMCVYGIDLSTGCSEEERQNATKPKGIRQTARMAPPSRKRRRRGEDPPARASTAADAAAWGNGGDVFGNGNFVS